jgi:hypothetical protein
MPDSRTDNTLFGDDPQPKVLSPSHRDGESQEPAPPDARGQYLVFCPRCGGPSDGASDFCGRCGARLCASCGE